MKHCRKCSSDKSLEEFYFDKRRDTYSAPCRECRKATVKLLNNKWRKENPEKARISGHRTKLKITYGISPEQLHDMWAAQGGKCALSACHNLISIDSVSKSKKAHIDHCHVSGVVRGLLCLTCNTGIGMLNDSIDLLDAAKHYLQPRGASTVKGDTVPASVSADNTKLHITH